MTEKKKKETKESIYKTLSKIDVKQYLDVISYETKKGNKFNLKYLSWAKAWGLVKSIYPNATYKIKEYPNWISTPDGVMQAGTLDYRITSVGCEVEVTAFIEGNEYTQKLYPMDQKNNPIMRPTIKDINKAQMRCLVKALALAGLGLEVYAGEDIPEEPAKKPSTQNKAKSMPAYPPTYQYPRKLSKAQLEDYTVEFSDGEKRTLKEIFKRAETNDVVRQWIKSGKHDNTTATYIKQLGGIYKAEKKIKAESNQQPQQPASVNDDGFEDIIAK
ncbi:DUF1071 domain-containing protein [Lactobacillus johnsonii]|uniref:Sak single strand annealing protein n=1 Tax=Lactobacillus johnsonii TaxID=33959 RepID=UPI00260C5C4D